MGLNFAPYTDLTAQLTFDPTVDPLSQGFQTDGTADYTNGSRLVINDTSSAAHRTFYKTAPEIATGAVAVDVTVQVLPSGLTLVGDDTGVRAILGEGAGGYDIIAALLDHGSGDRRVCLDTIGGGFSTGIPLDWSTEQTFRIERNPDPARRAVLIVSGHPPEVLTDADLPNARRGNANFEFGCSLDPATAVARFGPMTVHTNRPPVAYGGPAQTVGELNFTWLSALGPTNPPWSYDPDGDPLTFRWRQLTGPPVGCPGALLYNGVALAETGFFAPLVGPAGTNLTFELTVSDGRSTATNTVAVTVTNGAYADNARIILNPLCDPFTQGFRTDGTVPYATGGRLLINDATTQAHRTFYKAEPEIATNDVTVDVTVQVSSGAVILAGGDTGVRVILGEGTFGLEVGAALIDRGAGDRRVCLVTGGGFTTGIPLDWTQEQTFQLQRNNDPNRRAVLIVPGQPPDILTDVDLPASRRPEPRVEFGCSSDPATAVTFFGPVISIGLTNNHPPVADAGADQDVPAGRLVTLDATGSSDPNWDPLTYQWVQTTGPAVTLDLAIPARPRFTAPLISAGIITLAFQLTVSDGSLSSTDLVQVLVHTNRPPVAYGGPTQTVGELNFTWLSALGPTNPPWSYDPDGDPLTFLWRQLTGPPVGCPGAMLYDDVALAETGFLAPLVGPAGTNLTFELTVSDGHVIATNTVAVTVTNGAYADNTRIILNPLCGDPLTQGFQTDGTAPYTPGSRLVINDVSSVAHRTFYKAEPEIATNDITLDVTVEVSSGSIVLTGEDTGVRAVLGEGAGGLEIGAALIERGPGNRRVCLVTGGGFSSGIPLEWTQEQTFRLQRNNDPNRRAVLIVSGHPPEILSDVDLPASRRPEPRVEFGCGSDAAAAVAFWNLMTIHTNRPPVAYGGPNQTVAEGGVVGLSALGPSGFPPWSHDPDGDPLTFRWRQLTGPPVGCPGAMLYDGVAMAETGFLAPLVGPAGTNFNFELTVSDGHFTATNTLAVTVTNGSYADDVRIILNPLCDPLAQGYQTDGTGNYAPGSRLVINDSSAVSHRTFIKSVPQVAASAVAVDVTVSISPGSIALTGADTGVRAILSEGAGGFEIAVALIERPGGNRRVAFAFGANNFSSGIAVEWTIEQTFRLERNPDPARRAVLTVPSQPPEVLTDADLPPARRPNPNFEFGCASDPAAAITFFGPVILHTNSLQISPTNATVAAGGMQTFTASGGAPPYTFSLVANNSGGSINPSNGLYTAGSTSNVTDTVRVTDSLGSAATATVSVTPQPPTPNIVWINPAGGDWQTAANWSLNRVPGLSDHALIDVDVTVTVNAPATVGALTLSSGTLSGDGTLTVNGTMHWMVGILTGGGTTAIASGGSLVLSGNYNKVWRQRTINNSGTIIWSGTGKVDSGQGAVLNNQAGGVVDVQNDQTLYYSQGGAVMTINNAGTFRKSGGAGTTSLGAIFNNNGSVLGQSGTLSLDGGGSSHGSFNAAAGAILNFGGGSMVLESNSTVSGAGTIGCSGGGVDINGGYNVGGNTLVNGGVASFDGTASTVNATLSDGTLGGTGTLTVNGTMNWTGGFMGGGGTTVIASGSSLLMSGNANKVWRQRTINNSGTIIWSGLGNVDSGLGAVLNNQAGGVFDAQNDQRLDFSQGGAVMTINNAGTFKKSGGAGTTSVQVLFNNNGNVILQSGTLAAAGWGFSNLLSGVLRGAGTLDVSQAAFVNEGTCSPGNSFGTLTVLGNFPQTTNGAINIEIGGTSPGVSHDQLIVGGIATLNGALNISLVNGFQPVAGDVFEIIRYASHTGAFNDITGLDISCGFSLQPTFNSGNLVLTAVGGGGRLQISPTNAIVATGKSQTFTASCGTPPYTFSFVANNSGGTINPGNGLYTAGSVVNVTDTVRVADTVGSNAVATVLVTAPTACVPAPAGLVSWWRAEGSAVDSVGTNHGTLLNGTTLAPGRVSLAFSFDGVNDLVNVPAAAAFDLQNAITLEAWISPATYQVGGGGSDAVIVGRPLGYRLGVLPDGHVRFAFPANGSPQVDHQVDSTSVVLLNTFTHVVATYDSGTGDMNIFLNGVLDRTAKTNGTVNASTRPLQIGGHQDPGFTGGFFTCAIDEVSIYDRALGTNEIQALFNAGSAGKCVPTLAIRLDPTNSTQFILTWPVVLGDSVVESTDSLGTPNWTRATEQSSLVGSNYVVKIRLTGPKRFLRLKR